MMQFGEGINRLIAGKSLSGADAERPKLLLPGP